MLYMVTNIHSFSIQLDKFKIASIPGVPYRQNVKSLTRMALNTVIFKFRWIFATNEW